VVNTRKKLENWPRSISFMSGWKQKEENQEKEKLLLKG